MIKTSLGERCGWMRARNDGHVMGSELDEHTGEISIPWE